MLTILQLFIHSTQPYDDDDDAHDDNDDDVDAYHDSDDGTVVSTACFSLMRAIKQ